MEYIEIKGLRPKQEIQLFSTVKPKYIDKKLRSLAPLVWFRFLSLGGAFVNAKFVFVL